MGLEEKVIKVVATAFKANAATITRNTVFKDAFGAKSFNFVMMSALLAEEFDVDITEIPTNDCITVGEVVDRVESLMKKE